MIPSERLPQRELVKRLRELVDYVSDPDHLFTEPVRYAESYARLISLARIHRAQLETRYVQHNIGKRRSIYICRLMGEWNGGDHDSRATRQKHDAASVSDESVEVMEEES